MMVTVMNHDHDDDDGDGDDFWLFFDDFLTYWLQSLFMAIFINSQFCYQYLICRRDIILPSWNINILISIAYFSVSCH